jgi:molybdopterin-guanine dinucleotide biosynthesis protein A
VSGLPPRETVAGIVLAGGAGTRMGAGRSKAWLATADGDPLLHVALATLVRVAQRLIVAAPESVDLPAPLPSPRELGDDVPGFAARRVFDLADGEGPLAGLVPALEHTAARGASRAFILAVDMPRFSVKELSRLAAPLEARADAAAVLPRTPRGLEPLFSYVKPDVVAPVLRAAWDAGERAVHRAFLALGPALVELDTTDPRSWPGGPDRLRSINTPADLSAVLDAAGPPT